MGSWEWSEQTRSIFMRYDGDHDHDVTKIFTRMRENAFLSFKSFVCEVQHIVDHWLHNLLYLIFSNKLFELKLKIVIGIIFNHMLWTWFALDFLANSQEITSNFVDLMLRKACMKLWVRKFEEFSFLVPAIWDCLP